MTTQQNLAENLYDLLETQENPQDIMDIIVEINDLNRWNFDMFAYEKYGFNASEFVIDLENPGQYHTIYGISLLDYVIELSLIEGDYDFDLYPLLDEIVKFLVINGAKSSPKIYNKWLQRSDMYYAPNGEPLDDSDPIKIRIYEKVKHYLGLFNTVNKLKNVRKKNRKAKTIQRRLRGNRSRLYNSDNPTKYMRNVPGLRKGVANKIDEGLIEDGIESPDRDEFKVEHFDPKWMSDREIEGTRLMADYVDILDQYGGNSYRNKYERCKKMSESQQRAIDRITRLYEDKLFEDMDRMDEQESMENNAMADYINNINQSGGMFDDLPIEIIDKELKKMNCKDRLSYCQTNRKSRDHCNSEPTLSEYIKPCRKKSKMNKTKRKTIEVSKRLQKKNSEERKIKVLEEEMKIRKERQEEEEEAEREAQLQRQFIDTYFPLLNNSDDIEFDDDDRIY